MAPMVLGLAPVGQGEMVHMQFYQQRLLIQTNPVWKAEKEVCRKGRAKFLLPLPHCQLLLLFCIRKRCSVRFPNCQQGTRILLLAVQEQVFSHIVTMGCDCVPCPVCKGRAPPPALQPAGAAQGSQGFGLGVKPKRNGRCFARGATSGYLVALGAEQLSEPGKLEEAHPWCFVLQMQDVGKFRGSILKPWSGDLVAPYKSARNPFCREIMSFCLALLGCSLSGNFCLNTAIYIQSFGEELAGSG